MKDGGPAFPRPFSLTGGGQSAWDQEGMSIRDVFACAALSALAVPLADSMTDARKWIWSEIATACYTAADAMLAERERER